MQKTTGVGGVTFVDSGVSTPVEQGSFTEYLTIPIKNTKVRLLIEGDVTPEVLTSLGRHLRLLRDDLPDNTAETTDETATEENSVIAEEAAESLLDKEGGSENGQHEQ